MTMKSLYYPILVQKNLISRMPSPELAGERNPPDPIERTRQWHQAEENQFALAASTNQKDRHSVEEMILRHFDLSAKRKTMKLILSHQRELVVGRVGR